MKLIRFLFKNSVYQQWQIIRHTLRKVKTDIWYKPFLRKCGNGCLIIDPILFTPSVIELGNGVYIGHHCRIEGITRYLDKHFDPSIILDNGVTIQQNAHITCAGRIEIGSDTALAANVTVTDIDHPYSDVTVAPEYQAITVAHVKIGRACKIYNNVTILPGVELGNHCIVAANSVVRKGVYPNFSVIAGTPGVIIKRYDTESGQWKKTNAEGFFSK